MAKPETIESFERRAQLISKALKKVKEDDANSSPQQQLKQNKSKVHQSNF